MRGREGGRAGGREERKSDEPKKWSRPTTSEGVVACCDEGAGSERPLTERKPDSECHPPDCALASRSVRLPSGSPRRCGQRLVILVLSFAELLLSFFLADKLQIPPPKKKSLPLTSSSPRDPVISNL